LVGLQRQELQTATRPLPASSSSRAPAVSILPCSCYVCPPGNATYHLTNYVQDTCSSSYHSDRIFPSPYPFIPVVLILTLPLLLGSPAIVLEAGIYFPSMGVVKSKYVPEEVRLNSSRAIYSDDSKSHACYAHAAGASNNLQHLPYPAQHHRLFRAGQPEDLFWSFSPFHSASINPPARLRSLVGSVSFSELKCGVESNN